MINEIPSHPPGMTPLRTRGESRGIQGRDGPAAGVAPDSQPGSPDGAAPETNRPQEQNKPLKAIVQELNGYVQDVQRELEFSIDQDNGEVIVKVVDARTQKVLREIPAEEVREMRKRLKDVSEKLFGSAEKTALLFHAKA